MYFLDRIDAGRQLAKLVKQQDFLDQETVVLGLPRGGLPVAYEIAMALDAPLDVIVVRKLGVPFQPELAMGAIGENGIRTINQDIVSMTGVSSNDLEAAERREQIELRRRSQRFRSHRPRIPLTGRTALIVDDGIATGSTARAACHVARAQGASRVVLAVPVAPPSTLRELRKDADDVICLHEAEPLWAVGEAYADFAQTSDDEVTDLLEKAEKRHGESARGPAKGRSARDEEIVVAVDSLRLAGHLAIPKDPKGLVVFAHGSGSSRHSPRNRFVAEVLNQAGLGTLLFDLLTPAEERERTNVFDIQLLGGRLSKVTDWLCSLPETSDVPISYFGASTGAAAALWAAAEPTTRIAAVVSRGGRPDLAGARLSEVRSPTLLIVGGHDQVVEELNRQAQDQLRCESSLVIVPGATHLFEEPGTLEEVAALACDWFLSHAKPGHQPPNHLPTWDPSLEHAREEAQGTELYEDPLGSSLRVEREEAQGVDVFADPDATVPVKALTEGSPGHETLTGDQVELRRNEEDEWQRSDPETEG
jgi:predicted phosphoribosyltransferase/pimeloyl-ACP methyl ester carboxylesterase